MSHDHERSSTEMVKKREDVEIIIFTVQTFKKCKKSTSCSSKSPRSPAKHKKIFALPVQLTKFAEGAIFLVGRLGQAGLVGFLRDGLTVRHHGVRGSEVALRVLLLPRDIAEIHAATQTDRARFFWRLASVLFLKQVDQLQLATCIAITSFWYHKCLGSKYGIPNGQT